MVSAEAYYTIKSELQAKEHMLAYFAVELAILKKYELGFVGPITCHWIDAPLKQVFLV